jgi:DNA primase catalytic core
MPRASQIEQLKAEISLPRLVEASGIALTKQGKEYVGLCPFHAEDTPSLKVSAEKNVFHCFGCGAGGSVIDWTMKKNGVSFRHAVLMLLEGATQATDAPGTGKPVKQTTVRVLEKPVTLDADDHKLLAQVIDYYHRTLKQSPEALEYLKKRGLEHPELIDTFKLGYANRSLGLRLPDKSRKEGAIMRERLEKLGLYRGSGHEHFNGSLVVPVLDAQGNVQEVYGRKIQHALRAGTPLHLYLPGPHRGVWNAAALTAHKEIILCEALLDAMTFWCAGFRNVTSSYGVEGFTDEMLRGFKEHGVKRVLIAYDRDEAGERGAQKHAALLMEAGIECWRIQFPKGIDANEYALKLRPAVKSLGLLIRKAVWLGKGAAPVRDDMPVAAPPAVRVASVAAKEEAPSSLAAAENSVRAEEAALPASPVPPAPSCDIDAAVNDTETVLTFGARRWRVRGLPRNLAVGVLKVNVMVSQDDAFHVDTLDLYNARARAVFLTQASIELRAPEDTLKGELGRVLLKLEQLQDEAIQKALEPENPSHPDMTDSEREAALALLKAPDLLERILADFARCGMVGEATNTLTAYLAATSRKLDAPLGVVVQSSTAAGKTSLMDAVLAFIPEEDKVKYSAMTGQSLYYLGEKSLKHKVLALAEEEGAQKASYALKLLQSEGELTIASTGTDASGNLITQEYRVEGPTALITTTTAIDVDEELMNRCLVLAVDEGREQTRAIHERQRMKRTLEGLRSRQEKQDTLTLHQNAQRLLQPLAVVNPYADRLTFLDDRTRTRRDHEKYLTLIDTIALLHQHQRPIKTLSQGERTVSYIEATAADILQATKLAHEVLGRSLDELPPQTRRLLCQIGQLVQRRAAEHKLQRRAVRFTRRELREHLGWGDTQLKVHLARLVDMELLLAHRGPVGLFDYELVYDGDHGGAPHLSGLIDAQALSYDSAWSGVSDAQSPSSRDAVGAQAGDGRESASAVTPLTARLMEESAPPKPKPHIVSGNGRTVPYTHPLPLAAHAS